MAWKVFGVPGLQGCALWRSCAAYGPYTGAKTPGPNSSPVRVSRYLEYSHHVARRFRASGQEPDSMKWVLLFVAVFIGSIAVFVAIPRPAFLWVANSVGVFSGGVSPASDATSAPQRSASAGGNSFETRRRETIQADVAGRARVIDGDTIEVPSTRIRLFGIDAPESAQGCLALRVEFAT